MDEPLLPELLQGGVNRLLGHLSPVDYAAGGILGLQCLIIWWVSAFGGPYRDDFRLQSMAVEQPLAEWALRSPGSHFAPLPRLVIAAQAYAAPWDVGVAAATTVALMLAQGVVMWLLLRELVGPRRTLLGPFLVYALSPVFIPSVGWWTQAVTLTPATTAILACLLMVTRYWRTRRLRYEVGVWFCYAVGLLSWEKSLLALPAMLAVTTLFLSPGDSLPKRFSHALRARRLWAGILVLTAAHLTYYALGPFDSGGEATRASPWVIVSYLWTNLTAALVPGLAGGPWRWETDTSPYFGIADPSVTMRLLAAAIVGCTVALAARRSHSRTLRAVVLILVVWLPGTAMLIVGRVTKFGISPAFDYRYLPEVAAISVVALALAFMPLRDAPAEPTREPGDAGYLLVLLAIYSAGALVSIFSWGSAWHDNPSRAFAGNLRTDLVGRDEPFQLFDTQLPAEVLSPLFDPYHTSSRALAPFNLDRRISYDAANPPSFVIDSSGQLQPARFAVLSEAVPGTSSSCGYPVNPRSGPVTIPLQQRVPPLSDTFLRLSMLSGAQIRLEVRLDSTEDELVVSPPGGLVVPEGLPAVLVPVGDRPAEAVTLTFLSPESGICVDKVSIGTPQPDSS